MPYDSNEKVFENANQMTAKENLYMAIFGERNPDWVGVAFPDFKKLMRYQKATEIFKILFRESEYVEIFFDVPEPFGDSCGGSVTIFEDASGCSAMVFENSEQIYAFSTFLKMVDSFDLEAGMTPGRQRYIKFDWFIDDPFLGKPEISE